MRTINLTWKIPETEEDRLGGLLLGNDSYDLLIDGDADVYKPNGERLLVFRKGILDHASTKAAWQNLRDAATPTDNRAHAAGEIHQGDQLHATPGRVKRTIFNRLKKDGTISNTNYAKTVNSGIVGYFDRNPRFPYCRTTAYNLEKPERFAAALPFIQQVAGVFEECAPERFAAQRAMIEQTNPDFYIHGTPFTTITVNRNWQTAVHKDKGDYAPGFGVMTALCAGHFDGCYLCFPAYRVAVNMRSRDVLLADVHEWHGNTPFLGAKAGFERISCIFYYRANMWKCGSAAEELEIVKNRKPGHLYAEHQD